MLLQSSSSPTLFTIRKILCHKCPATRSIEDLENIYSFLTSRTEIKSDPLWIFLPRVLQLELCAYFKYVRLDENQLVHVEPSNHGHTGPKLYLLVRGEGDLAYGNFTMPLNSKNGPRVGSIYMPRRIQCLVRHCSAENKGIYEAFVRRVQTSSSGLRQGIDRTRLAVSLHKGAHYIYFSPTECRNYISRLFDKIVYNWVFHKLYMQKVKSKKYCPYCFNLFVLPKGHLVFVEGSTTEMIVLTLRGKCRLKKKVAVKTGDVTSIEGTTLDPNNGALFVGFADPLSLLGFHPHVLNKDDNGEGLGGAVKELTQAYTVVAETRVHAVVFEPRSFMEWISTVPGMTDALLELTKRQLHWLTRTLPQRLKRRCTDLQDKEDEKIELAATRCNDVQSSTFMDDFPTSTCVDMEEIINSRELKKKVYHSNKHKLLKGLKRRIVQQDEDESADWLEYDELEDPFSRFDFIDTSMYNLQKEILLDDFARNNDDHSIEASIDIINDEDFNLKEKKQLVPHPSILLSRKLFGKTLPVIQQSKGFLNPYDS